MYLNMGPRMGGSVVCRTHDLVVVSLIPGLGELSFRLSHLLKHVRRMALERKLC